MTPVALVHTEERNQIRNLAPVDAQAKLIDMWLYNKAETTKKSYRRYITRFFAFVSKYITGVTLEDLYDFAKYLDDNGLAPATQTVYLAAVKSLLTFAQKIGMIKVNAGAAMTLKQPSNDLNGRILEELDVVLMVRMEPNERNKCILKLLYGAGLRVSELCSLKWENLIARGESGQVTVPRGKGGKPRSVVLPQGLWNSLIALKKDAPNNAPVFASRKGGGMLPLQRQNINPILKAAAERAGVTDKVSAHWLRHSHATHSLQKGADIGLVQATLGHANVSTTSRYLHSRPDNSSALYLNI